MAFGSDVSRVWTSVTATQPTPNSRAIAICGAIAFAMVAWAPAWRYTRHLVTICHEGAHGVAALLSGRRLAGITNMSREPRRRTRPAPAAQDARGEADGPRDQREAGVQGAAPEIEPITAIETAPVLLTVKALAPIGPGRGR